MIVLIKGYKPSSRVFAPFEMALPSLLGTGHQAPGIDGGQVEGMMPVSHVPNGLKCLARVSHRHPERSGRHFAGQLTVRQAMH